jgi:hypothetical protein
VALTTSVGPIAVGSPILVLEAARREHVRRHLAAPKLFILHSMVLADLAEALQRRGRSTEAAQALGMLDGTRRIVGVPVELDDSRRYPTMLCADGSAEWL